MFLVKIFEYESGWGSRLDSERGFDTEKEAKDYAIKYNSYNDSPNIPDWYMVAEYMGYVNDDYKLKD